MAATLDDIVYELQVNRGYLGAIEHTLGDISQEGRGARAAASSTSGGSTGRGFFGVLDSAISTTGIAGQQLARNNASGLAMTGLQVAQRQLNQTGRSLRSAEGAGGMAMLSRAAGTAAIGLGAVAGVATTAVSAVTGMVNAFRERANELAKWSPTIISAQVNANLRTMQADMREAQELGAGMGRMITLENDISLEIRELLLPIKKFLIEKLGDGMELVLDYIRIAKTEVIPNILGFFVNVIDLLNKLKPGDDIAQGIKRALIDMAAELRKKNDRPPLDLWDEIRKNAGLEIVAPGIPRDPFLGRNRPVPGL